VRLPINDPYRSEADESHDNGEDCTGDELCRGCHEEDEVVEVSGAVKMDVERVHRMKEKRFLNSLRSRRCGCSLAMMIKLRVYRWARYWG
jgi:hypothetical protein